MNNFDGQSMFIFHLCVCLYNFCFANVIDVVLYALIYFIVCVFILDRYNLTEMIPLNPLRSSILI